MAAGLGDYWCSLWWTVLANIWYKIRGTPRPVLMSLPASGQTDVRTFVAILIAESPANWMHASSVLALLRTEKRK